MFTFDLEKAIAAWRKSLRHNRAFLRDDVDELESHLRDHVDTLVDKGLTEKEAFECAIARLGDTRELESEYRKVRWGRTRRMHTALKSVFWDGAILKSYFKIALRNLKRHPGYSFINIGGLAVGMATCFVIMLFVRYELSYDDFNEHAKRIYRVLTYAEIGDRVVQDLGHSAMLAPTLAREVPGVENAVRLSTRYPEVLVKREDDAYYESNFYFTDSTFFDIFSTKFLHGDSETALGRPYAVVITESIAQKYFGGRNPVGRSLSIEGLWGPQDYEVTAVVEDFPPNAHFHFGFLTSMATLRAEMPNPEDFYSWRHVGHYTYVLLRPNATATTVGGAFQEVHARYRGTTGDNRDLVRLELQPLTEIHLHSHLEDELEPTFDVRYIYIFSVLALLVLTVACINYMNLATARSARRAREVGVRKVMGAYRSHLVSQFLGESIVFGGIALVFALLLLIAFVPLFNTLSGRDLALTQLVTGEHIATMLAIGALVGLAAGFYPAVFLSRFQPMRVLRGLVGLGAGSKHFRSALVVTQFAISFGLIGGTLVVGDQLDYMQTKNLGLDEERVVVVNTHGALARQFPAFRAELLEYPEIENATAANPAPPVHREGLNHWPEGFDGFDVSAAGISVGPAFLETMKIQLLEGKDLPDRRVESEFLPVLINQAAAREFGWEQPIGKTFRCCFRPTPKVVGVVEDFHYRSVREQITPLVLQPTWWSRFVLVRIRPGDIQESVARIAETWQRFVPDAPFDFNFMDAQFEATYRSEQQLARIFGAFSALSIVIACMGLFGLAAFMVESRTKEIGIRKVLGATVTNIVGLVSRDFVTLVVISILIGAPIVYLASRQWLQDFAYRASIGLDLYLIAGLLSLAVASFTVTFQAVKAALINPARSLRHE